MNTHVAPIAFYGSSNVKIKCAKNKAGFVISPLSPLYRVMQDESASKMPMTTKFSSQRRADESIVNYDITPTASLNQRCYKRYGQMGGLEKRGISSQTKHFHPHFNFLGYAYSHPMILHSAISESFPCHLSRQTRLCMSSLIVVVP